MSKGLNILIVGSFLVLFTVALGIFLPVFKVDK